jgi:FkbM family methyltransferase
MNPLKKIFKKIAYAVDKEQYNSVSNLFQDFDVIVSLPEDDLIKLIRSKKESKSQIFQDLFVLLELGFCENGYFVEFGATNGVDLSNTYLLEKKFNWTGILAEPGRVWHHKLKNSRKCNIDMGCVWKDSKSILSFNETKEPELSTIIDFNSNDWASSKRRHGTPYEVHSISLEDLLKKYSAPSLIDYLSIDTEGSEYEILSNFNFDKYKFKIITCEHNYTPMRKKIYNLLVSKGYQRKYEGFSRWDDWYVLAK